MLTPGAVETGAYTTRSFATYSAKDPYTGLIYTCWKQQTANGRNYIICSNGIEGDVVYEDPGQYSTASGALPGFYYLAITDTEIIAAAIRPSASDGVTKVWWIFRANKSNCSAHTHESYCIFALPMKP